MSHMVEVAVKMTNKKAIINAAKALGVATKEVSNMKFYRSEDTATGTAVYLSGWKYPMVIEKDGNIKMDNYNGSWGSNDRLNEFKQEYSHEALKIKLRLQRKRFTSEKINGKYKVKIAL